MSPAIIIKLAYCLLRYSELPLTSDGQNGGNMFSKDWFDALMMMVWVGIWSALVYLLPFAGV